MSSMTSSRRRLHFFTKTGPYVQILTTKSRLAGCTATAHILPTRRPIQIHHKQWQMLLHHQWCHCHVINDVSYTLFRYFCTLNQESSQISHFLVWMFQPRHQVENVATSSVMSLPCYQWCHRHVIYTFRIFERWVENQVKYHIFEYIWMFQQQQHF